MEGRVSQWYERQSDITKLSWEQLSVRFIIGFRKKDSYKTLICELSQAKQELE